MTKMEKPKTYQLGRKKIEPWKALDAIYAKCMDCCGYNALEAEKRGYKLNDDDLSEANQERINCGVKTCPLWMFRIGKNPYTSGGTGNTDALIEYRKTKTNREE